MTRPEGRSLRASEPWERESLKSRPRSDLEGHLVLSLPPSHPPLHVSSPCIGMPGPGWHQWSFLWGRLGLPVELQAGVQEPPAAPAPQTQVPCNPTSPSCTHGSSLPPAAPPSPSQLMASPCSWLPRVENSESLSTPPSSTLQSNQLPDSANVAP